MYSDLIVADEVHRSARRRGILGVQTCELPASVRAPTGEVSSVPTGQANVPLGMERDVEEPSSRTVLVVDDDPGVLEVLDLALSAEGYRVVLARNGREALDQAAESHPNLMLVDLMMPVMDGWQFVRACRERHFAEQTPVIILSAARNVEQAARELGVQAVIAKPFNLDHLLDLVAAHAA